MAFKIPGCEDYGSNPSRPFCRPLMSSRKGRIISPPLILFLVIYFLSTVSTSALERQVEAERMLTTAIRAYRAGSAKRADLFLKMAVKADWRWAYSRYETHKLRALLYLIKNRRAEAADSMVKAVQLRGDPFLFYMLGQYNLDLHSWRQAANSYRRAVEEIISRGGDSDIPLLPTAFPFGCPLPDHRDPGKHDSWLNSHHDNPFADFNRFDEYWTRSLHPVEFTLALYQAFTLSRLFSEDASRQEHFRNLLQTALTEDLLDDSPLDGFFPLIRNPWNEHPYRHCLQGLRELEEREKRAIRRGLTEKSLLNIKVLRQSMEMIHRNRIAWFRNARAYYGYGSFLLRNNRKISALNIFRQALRILNPQIHSDRVDGKLNEIAHIYRGLEQTYRAMGRFQDTTTLAALADEIEKHQSGSLEYSRRKMPDRKKADRLLIIRLLRNCRLNTGNREALLLLISFARNTRESGAEKRYRLLLASRDAAFENREFPEAYRTPP